MEAWQSILLAIGGNTALIVVLAWLARSLVRNSLTRDLENYKSELALATQSATDRLRHDLQLVAQEHQVIFSKLQERRASVIGEAYGLLVEAYREGSRFTSPISFGEPDKNREYVSAINTMAAFYDYFDKNRIYLPEPICEKIESLTKDMRSQVLRMGGYIQFNDDVLGPAAMQKKWDAWESSWTYFQEQAPAARSLLERELRLLIGDEPSVNEVR